jgi:hypothetical protein
MSYIWTTLNSLVRLLTLPALRALAGLMSTISYPLARAAAGIALIIAAVALAHDLGPATVGRTSDFHATAVLTHWQQLAPESLLAASGFATKRLQPWVWSAATAPLKLPTFIVFAVLGAVFGYLGRRRQRVEIFAN